MQSIKEFGKYPWWWSLYSFVYADELWKPSIKFNLINYNQQYEFNTNSNDIKYECLSEKNIKNPKMDFVNYLTNSVFDNMSKTVIMSQRRTNKLKELVRKKKFNSIIRVNEQYNKSNKHIGEYIRSHQVQLKLTNKQIKIIRKWFDVATKVYNKCVDAYNNSNGKVSLDFRKLKQNIINSLNKKDRKSCPYNILSYEVKVFCENIKSSLTQIKEGNITHFTVNHKKNKNNRTITIEKANIQNNGFYKTFLGSIVTIDKMFSFANIECDCKLSFNLKQEKFYLYVPQYRVGKTVQNRNPIAALDPGEKVFMSFYGLDHIGMIGKDIRIKILKYHEQIKYIQRKISKNKHRTQQLIIALTRKYKKIKGLIKELHNKTALYLCKNYNIILIPKFETQSMISDKGKAYNKIKANKQKIINENKSTIKINQSLKIYKKKTRLNARVKFVLNNLSHYKFKQQLFSKGEEYGCLVVEVDESYTSKTCGNCGLMSDKYKNRVKECTHCKFQMDRDYNGSRNILIKNRACLPV